jgi:hypothetical protein
MKEIRANHTLRFSDAGWKLITIRAKEKGRSRARYLEELTLNEAANAENK